MSASKTEEELNDQFIIDIFEREIARQCTFAQIAMENIFACLQNMDALHKKMTFPNSMSPSLRPDHGDFAKFWEDRKREMEIWIKERDELSQKDKILSDNFWYSLQNFLVAAGNISKILWVYPGMHPKKPPEPTSQDKREMKRAEELRKIYSIEEDSPLKNRKFRNHFEHFDEIIDSWISNSKRMCFVDTNIGLKIGGVDRSDCFRNFDPSKFILTFSGEEYELLPVHKAIRNLHQEVIENLDRH